MFRANGVEANAPNDCFLPAELILLSTTQPERVRAAPTGDLNHQENGGCKASIEDKRGRRLCSNIAKYPRQADGKRKKILRITFHLPSTGASPTRQSHRIAPL